MFDETSSGAWLLARLTAKDVVCVVRMGSTLHVFTPRVLLLVSHSTNSRDFQIAENLEHLRRQCRQPPVAVESSGHVARHVARNDGNIDVSGYLMTMLMEHGCWQGSCSPTQNCKQ